MEKLDNYADFIMGQAPSSKECNLDGIGMPFVKAGQFGEYEPAIEEWTTNPLKTAQKDDVLICVVGATSGKLNRGIECAIGRSVAAIRPKEDVRRDYIYYGLHPWIFRLRNGSQGSAIGVITKDMLADVEMPFPAIDEQDRIISVLQSIENIIKSRKQELKKFDELIKARFVEMFESKSWNTVRAGSVMTNMRNGVSPSNTGTYPAKVLTLSAITQGSFDPTSWKDGMFDSEPKRDKRVTASDFYMCRGNGNKSLVGAGVYSKEDRYDLVFPDTAIAATVNLQKVCLPYLFHVWKRPSVRDQIELGARTTNGTYKINQGVVSNIELMLPPIELQAQFAAFVEQVDKSKVVVQKTLY